MFDMFGGDRSKGLLICCKVVLDWPPVTLRERRARLNISRFLKGPKCPRFNGFRVLEIKQLKGKQVRAGAELEPKNGAFSALTGAE